MKQRTNVGLAALACVAIMGTALTAKALMIALPPMPQRVATATAVYEGKISEVTEKAVAAGKGDTRQMKIATLKVSQTLLGKGAREVKLAFYLPPTAVPGRPGGIRIRPPISSRRGYGPQFAKGQEGLFLLHKHPTLKDTYVLADFQGFLSKPGNPGYAGQVTEIKDAAKVLANPMKGLASKDAAERLKTVGLLVARYRSSPPGSAGKQEEVPAAQSKIILTTLAEADWTPRPGRYNPLTPQNLFFRLGLTPADGWMQPRNFAEVPAAAKKWLKDNAGKYKMKRYVREDSGVSEEPGAPAK